MITITPPNNIDLKGVDVKNKFLTVLNKDNVWLKASKWFGSMEGHVLIFIRALYEMNSDRELFRSFMDQKLDNMGFKLYKAYTWSIKYLNNSLSLFISYRARMNINTCPYFQTIYRPSAKHSLCSVQ